MIYFSLGSRCFLLRDPAAEKMAVSCVCAIFQLQCVGDLHRSVLVSCLVLDILKTSYSLIFLFVVSFLYLRSARVCISVCKSMYGLASAMDV